MREPVIASGMRPFSPHRHAPFAFALLAAGACAAAGCARSSRSMASPNDSLALADSAHRACGSLDSDPRQTCYSSILDPLVATRGVRVAMGTLNRLGALDPSVQNDGHVFAHGIGIAAGKAGSDLARTFASCTEIFQSGCYHGVIQAYFEHVHAVDTAAVNAMCAPWTAPSADRWLRFQCVHGMGHGLTMFYAHDLPRALGGCDLLRDDWDRESCYGGAFMENIVNATDPHHHPGASLHVGPAADSKGHAAMAGMEGHDHAAFRPLDPQDMQYPCSAIAEKYWNQCYQMQTAVMLHYNHGDMASAARTCQQAPGVMRYVCHQSLGRDISSYASGNASDAVRMCSLADREYQPWCHVGVVKNFIDVTAKAEDGIAYCEVVPGDRNKALCYEAVGEQIATLRAATSDREALCHKVEAVWRNVCRYGATLQPARPSLIPSPKAG